MENTDYLDSVRKQFEYYKLLGDKTFEQLSHEQMLFQYNDDSNSIALIVKHLHGNMLSRWTDFLTSDGEKDWRDRDSEFEAPAQSKEQIIQLWNEGWACLFNAINPLTENDLSRTIYIRNQGHSVMEAINRQLAHYPYHVGQIVFIGKMMTDGKWKTLSIAKNQSKAFNSEKFAQPKHKAHFTDEVLKKKEKE